MIEPVTLFPDDPAPTPQKLREETVSLRQAANDLFLFALCRHAGCYREKSCRGEPRHCLARLAPLVPQSARDWVKLIFEGHAQAHSCAEAGENYPEQREAYADWEDAVARSLEPMAPRGTVPQTPAAPAPPPAASRQSPRVRAPWD